MKYKQLEFENKGKAYTNSSLNGSVCFSMNVAGNTIYQCYVTTILHMMGVFFSGRIVEAVVRLGPV